MKTKKSVGAKLRLAREKWRRARHEQALAAADGEGPTVQLDSDSRTLMAEMFRDARRRIAGIIDLKTGSAEVRVRLGRPRPGRVRQVRQR